MTSTTPKFPKVVVDLSGINDPLSIIEMVVSEMKAAGVDESARREFMQQIFAQLRSKELMSVVAQWISVAQPT